MQPYNRSTRRRLHIRTTWNATHSTGLATAQPVPLKVCWFPCFSAHRPHRNSHYLPSGTEGTFSPPRTGSFPIKRCRRASTGEELHTNTIRNETTDTLPLGVVLFGVLREAPILGREHLLPARKLELRTPQSLHRDVRLVLLGSDGQQDLADVHAGNGAVRFSESTAHARLQDDRLLRTKASC